MFFRQLFLNSLEIIISNLKKKEIIQKTYSLKCLPIFFPKEEKIIN